MSDFWRNSKTFAERVAEGQRRADDASYRGRMAGGLAAWTTRNYDPRGAFIATPFPESDWPKYRDAYERGFEKSASIRKLAPGGAS